MAKIKPFEAEKAIASQIDDNSTRCGMILCEDKDNEKIIKAVKLFPDNGNDMREHMRESMDPDVMKVYAILVTTDWNKNDDIFTPDETIKAVWTPRYKPANMEHLGSEDTENQIIGCICDTFPCNDNYEYSYKEEELAKGFHILVGINLWEKYFPSTVSKLKDEISKGEQFVSMECMFSDFGYGLHECDDKGERLTDKQTMLMPRNEITSKLSSSLRAYGGSGQVYIEGKKYKIGRWLKSFVFSGVGFVKNPANPKSIIFEDFISKSSFKSIEERELKDLVAKISEIKIDKIPKLRVLNKSKGSSLWQI